MLLMMFNPEKHCLWFEIPNN